ncbi:hypothetical protein [Streptomyces sp. NPDC056663]|uniref:hypothetical protein n=1 Tax=Streptomyces sp. NPDC056663 TaxID=3345899 RepID=UPI0036B7A328
MSVGPGFGQWGADGLQDGEASHLQDWANQYAHSWKAMRGGGPVDMERFLRRLARPEAGLTDCAYYAKPGVLVGIVEKAGLPYENLSEDVAYTIGIGTLERAKRARLMAITDLRLELRSTAPDVRMMRAGIIEQGVMTEAAQ